MSGDRFPHIMGLFGLVDGLLGCVFGLIKLAFWLLAVLIVVAALHSPSP